MLYFKKMSRQLVYGQMSKSLDIKIYVWLLHGVYKGLESTYKMYPGNPKKKKKKFQTTAVLCTHVTITSQLSAITGLITSKVPYGACLL